MNTSSTYMPGPIQVTTGQVPVSVSTIPQLSNKQAYSAIKRWTDIILALAVLILTIPLFLLICGALLVQGRPVFYYHQRVGRAGQIFNCMKFRTMRIDGDLILSDLLQTNAAAAQEWEQNHKLRNDPRVTKLGNFLRRTSLDELPQLINVFCGSMSLVGPRPVVAEELDRHFPPRAVDSYLSVRPGLTGLWQTSGRSDLEYPARVALECSYVETMSFYRDMRLLLSTIKVLLRRSGAH